MSLCITPLQEAWLTEIGVDALWLARFRQAPGARGSATAAPVAATAVAAPTAPTASAASAEDAESAATPPVADMDVSGRAAGPVSVAALLGADTVANIARPKPGRQPVAARIQSGVPAREIPDLATLHAHILVCEACPLHAGRSHAVPGMGESQTPDYLIVGEMPGVDDDMSGKPFQGAAGDLLQAMLASAGLAQKTAFMSTVIKCRPSGGRAAQATEVAACLPYLRQQIELLRPQRILALGRLAARAVLDTRDSLAVLRGRVHHYQTATGQSIPVWVTHHPASLLLRPAYKAEAWRDLMQLAAAQSAAPRGSDGGKD